jgi:hypothetical protein
VQQTIKVPGCHQPELAFAHHQLHVRCEKVKVARSFKAQLALDYILGAFCRIVFDFHGHILSALFWN